jgi:hypothetical protein
VSSGEIVKSRSGRFATILLATISFATFGATPRAFAQGEPWPMPVDRSFELLPLLRSDKAEVRREALRQLVPPHADRNFRHWNGGLVPLDRQLGLALADAVTDDDPEVAAAALALLPDVVFSVGGPAEMVRRWALQKAPFTDFSHATAAALAAADQRWPVDALLELVETERKREAPALPRELLDAAWSMLRVQASPAQRAKDSTHAPVRLRDDLDVEPAPHPIKGAPEFDGPQPTFAEVPGELLTRLRSNDPATALAAYEELERLALGRLLPPELLAPLIDVAIHAPDGVGGRLAHNVLRWGIWIGDPAPLLDWWRFQHGVSDYAGSMVAQEFGEKLGARFLPILEVIAREGGAEDRRAIARLLNYPPSVWGKPPLGDALLKQLMESPDAENVDDLLRALDLHPAVIPSVLPQLEAWLDDPQWYQVVAIASLAGPAAASFVPKIVANCEREKWNLARFSEELPRFGAAAVAPLAKAFDEKCEPFQRVRLAAALLALHARDEEALACLVALAGDATGHPSTRADAFTTLAREKPDEPRLLATCRDALVAEDREMLHLAWSILARHFGLKVDDEGIVRPG